MNLVLKNKVECELRMMDLEDGDLAIIIDRDYKGRIIHIYNDKAIAIGKSSGNSFSPISNNNLLVKRLVSGDTIKVEEEDE